MTEKNTQKTNKTEIYNFEKIIKNDKTINIYIRKKIDNTNDQYQE